MHTNHANGDNGKYFFFSTEGLNKMAGNKDWNGKVLEVNQKGSQSWQGQVKVWKDKPSNPGSHGRREVGAQPGQWVIGDTIKLTNCDEAGKSYRKVELFFSFISL